MAGLSEPATPIRRRDQLAAIAYLRWRLFANAFRRKGSTAELIARILLYPIVLGLALIPITVSAGTAYYAISAHHPGLLSAVTWGVFGLSVVLSINLAPPTLAFDPASLIRFPLSFPAYLTTRLFLGLLSASNVVCSLSLAAAVIAIGIARASLAPVATLAFGLYALSLMLLTRMVFAWVDRWLATRRGRSIFTGLLFLFGLSAQAINFYVTGDHGHHRLDDLARRHHLMERVPQIVAAVRQLHWVSNFLPPGLASASVTASVRVHGSIAFAPMSLAYLGGTLTFSAIFLGVFAWRMHKEFRGENLSEAAHIPEKAEARHTVAENLAVPSLQRESTSSASVAETLASTREVVLACLHKELIYLRRSGPLVMLLLSPLVLVYFMASRMGDTPGIASWVFPAASTYSLLGISAGSYNIFGTDLTGVQMYFLAPVRLRDIVLAKNLITSIILSAQILLTWIVVALAQRPPSLPVTLTTLLWFVAAVAVNTAIGNRRSITAPRRIALAKPGGKQASAISAFMGIGVLLGCAALAAIALGLGQYFAWPWLAPATMLLLAPAAVALYLSGLNHLEALALDHREALSEELCKA